MNLRNLTGIPLLAVAIAAFSFAPARGTSRAGQAADTFRSNGRGGAIRISHEVRDVTELGETGTPTVLDELNLTAPAGVELVEDGWAPVPAKTGIGSAVISSRRAEGSEARSNDKEEDAHAAIAMPQLGAVAEDVHRAAERGSAVTAYDGGRLRDGLADSARPAVRWGAIAAPFVALTRTSGTTGARGDRGSSVELSPVALRSSRAASLPRVAAGFFVTIFATLALAHPSFAATAAVAGGAALGTGAIVGLAIVGGVAGALLGGGFGYYVAFSKSRAPFDDGFAWFGAVLGAAAGAFAVPMAVMAPPAFILAGVAGIPGAMFGTLIGRAFKSVDGEASPNKTYVPAHILSWASIFFTAMSLAFVAPLVVEHGQAAIAAISSIALAVGAALGGTLGYYFAYQKNRTTSAGGFILGWLVLGAAASGLLVPAFLASPTALGVAAITGGAGAVAGWILGNAFKTVDSKDTFVPAYVHGWALGFFIPAAAIGWLATSGLDPISAIWLSAATAAAGGAGFGGSIGNFLLWKEKKDFNKAGYMGVLGVALAGGAAAVAAALSVGVYLSVASYVGFVAAAVGGVGLGLGGYAFAWLKQKKTATYIPAHVLFWSAAGFILAGAAYFAAFL